MIFQRHCEPGQGQITLQELLRFCVNAKVFPVSNKQDLASSQTIHRLASRIVGKSEDIKLSFGQFERFLKLLGSSSLPGAHQELYTHIDSPCQRVYGVKLTGNTASLRGSFLDLTQAESRLSMDSSPSKSMAAKRLFKVKSMPKLSKRSSLVTTLIPSKANMLKKIYTRPITRKMTLFEPSPKASTMRNERFSEESASPSAAQTLVRPFFSRVPSRNGSVSKDQMNRIKTAFSHFKTQVSAWMDQPRVKPRPVVTLYYLTKVLKRRIQPVYVI